MVDVKFDKYSLEINGERVFVRSGAFHYFRTPGVELARDRFSKLKAAGYNTVDIYLNANYHSKAESEYDFVGRDCYPAEHDFGDIKDIWKNEKGADIKTYAIITTAPNTLMAKIYTRMPVILKREDEDQWLDHGMKDVKTLLTFLTPYPANEMVDYPISTKVNLPINDDPSVLLPA